MTFKKNRAEIIEVDEGFSVKPAGMSQLVYTQGTKTLLVDLDILVGRYLLVVYAGQIRAWTSGELIDEESKRKIADNIRRAFEWDGSEIRVEW